MNVSLVIDALAHLMQMHEQAQAQLNQKGC